MLRSFFDDGEYFSHVEAGWTPTQDRIHLDNVHLTAWHADRRDRAGVLKGRGLRDQTTAELFYRVQLSPNCALTPDVQLVINPALVPGKGQIWYFGVRARLAL